MSNVRDYGDISDHFLPSKLSYIFASLLKLKKIFFSFANELK